MTPKKSEPKLALIIKGSNQDDGLWAAGQLYLRSTCCTWSIFSRVYSQNSSRVIGIPLSLLFLRRILEIKR